MKKPKRKKYVKACLSFETATARATAGEALTRGSGRLRGELTVTGWKNADPGVRPTRGLAELTFRTWKNATP